MVGTATTQTQATGRTEVKAPVSAGLGKKTGGVETTPERTYRQADVDALLGKAGQKVQAKLDEVTKERDTFKGQLDTLTEEITEARESLTTLNKEIEAMSEDDPSRKALVSLRREREAELKAAKALRVAAEADVNEHKQWKRDQLVYTVADEYVTSGGDAVDLETFKRAADRFKIKDREELEGLAETLGFSPKEGTLASLVTPSVKPYSGKTDGGKAERTEEDRLKERYPTMYK